MLMRQQCPRIMPCFRVHATFLLILKCLCNLVPIFAQVHRPLLLKSAARWAALHCCGKR